MEETIFTAEEIKVNAKNTKIRNEILDIITQAVGDKVGTHMFMVVIGDETGGTTWLEGRADPELITFMINKLILDTRNMLRNNGVYIDIK